MALQHIRAFRARREEFGDQINQDIAHAIADHMGYDDSPATVSIKTLATEARCHYNTADKRTKEMAAAGLIKIDKQGKLLCYSIPGKYEDVTRPPVEPTNPNDDIERLNGRMDNLEKKVDGLCEDVRRLSHDLHIIVTSSSHDLHTTFTPNDTNRHTAVTRPVYGNVNEVVEVVEEGKGERNAPAHDNDQAILDFLKANDLPSPRTADEWTTLCSPEGITWIEATGYWPGYDVLGQLGGKFGPEPSEEILSKAWELWTLSGFKKNNVLGVIDFYNSVKADPNWTPSDRFKKPTNNGHHKAPAAVPSQGLVEIEPGVY